MKTELWPLERLIDYARNPRKNDHAVDRVAAAIKEFGFRVPIIAKSDGLVVDGHLRLKAARKLGLVEVPVVLADDLTDAQVKAFRISVNRMAELAEWDSELLALELGELGELGFDLDLTGFAAGEIDALTPGGTEGLTDPDEVPEPPVVPTTQPGDLWLLGEHRVLCGDSTKAEDVARLMGGALVNVAFTSPPYASQRKYDENSGFKPIAPDDFVAWFEPIAANVKRHLSADGSWFVNIKEHCDDGQRSLYVKDLTIAHVRQWGWMLKDENVWRHHGKPGRVWATFKNQWEPIFHFATTIRPKCRPENVSHASLHVPSGGGGNMSKSQGSGADSGFDVSVGMAYPGNVIECGSSEGGHPAAFPVGLPSFFIKAFSDAGDVIYEPFLGSGTTLIAAEQLGRKCYGMEISPAYCDVIVKRWEQFTGKQATRESARVT